MCLHVLKTFMFVDLVQYCVSALKQGMYELCIHEASSELVKITHVSCGDFDIYIYFKALFFLDMCLCVYARNYVAVRLLVVCNRS